MNKKRYLYSIIGVIVLLFAGVIYSWSVISSPIKAEFPNWTFTQLSRTFTLCMIFFCLGGFISGITSKFILVKIRLYISAILFFLGFFMVSKLQSILILYIGYGVFCGLASGISYNCIMSTISLWFPDKQGFISGFLLMGFGFGSMIMGLVFSFVTSERIGAWRNTFYSLGIVIAVVIAIASLFLEKPSDGVIKEYKTVSPGTMKKTSSDCTPSEMIKSIPFWLFFFWSILLSASGLAVISQATTFAKTIGDSKSSTVVAFVVGLISICNGTGRILWGFLFDKIGRKITMLLIDIAFIISISMLIASLLADSFAIVVIAFILMGLSYAGIPPTNSAFINARYGSLNYPVNYSIVNLNLIIASFGSTIAGRLYDLSGSYLSTFIMMLGANVMALLCTILIQDDTQ